MTQHPGWLLVVAGLIIFGIGVVWLLAPSIPWLGKLPGDISVERENLRFYFPVVTIMPRTPASVSASRTSSSLNGLIVAMMSFTSCPLKFGKFP